MSSVGGIGGAGSSVGGAGAISPVSPASAPGSATESPSKGLEGVKESPSDGDKSIVCHPSGSMMSTENFVTLNNNFNINDKVPGIEKTEQIELNLKKLLELLIAMKLMESMSESGQKVGSNLNITA